MDGREAYSFADYRQKWRQGLIKKKLGRAERECGERACACAFAGVWKKPADCHDGVFEVYVCVQNVRATTVTSSFI
jgi:hypothetical protein